MTLFWMFLNVKYLWIRFLKKGVIFNLVYLEKIVSLIHDF